ncbi:MAG: hypothetical protein HC847_14310 [Hydrococcus sp. RU_2_2]|nr:hypothetical protein [Hydrococcus sp. RU_2_2]NJP22145.1 hypothetical protein [Hydrococcus sp. CRU_1_1]
MNKIFKTKGFAVAPSAIAIIGCSSLLSPIFSSVFEGAIASSRDSSPNTTEIESQANQKPDFRLLVKALGNFFQKSPT